MLSLEDRTQRNKESLKKAQHNLRIRKLLKKLNDNVAFKRFPYARIEKYDIKYNNETKCYFIPV